VTNTMKDARYSSCGRKALQFLDMAIAKYWNKIFKSCNKLVICIYLTWHLN
jgi:hypothetical protein